MVEKIDPRLSLIDENIKDIKNIILVSGFKGGVGKSLVSTLLSLSLSDKGYKVGLFDLDITSFTCHRILGVYDLYPYEENGIVPPQVYGVSFMSFQFFSTSQRNLNHQPNLQSSKIRAVAMRGSAISDAVKEILTVTRWGKLDYLIIDMPPGFYDIAFDVMNLIKRFKILVVKTSSPLSREVYTRMITIYKERGYEIIEVENMSREEGDMKIRFDPEIDNAVGNVERIKTTNFYHDILKIAARI